MAQNSAELNDTLSSWRSVRAQYLSVHYVGEAKRVGDLVGIQKDAESCPSSRKCNSSSWGDVDYHLSNRISSVSKLVSAFPELTDKHDSLKDIVDKGYKLSILPLNSLVGSEVYQQFVPPEDFFCEHKAKTHDPYGIYTQQARVMSADEEVWLGSRKFRHTLLVNVHSYCPIGCSDCYKSFYTRENNVEKRGINNVDASNTAELEKQVDLLVDWLNVNSEVYDVIISGGEPFIRPDSHIKTILKSLQKARHLRVLRFCTGALFLGLPFRFTDALLDILDEFRANTGINVRIHAHLSNWRQISPEAVIAITRIRKRGFSIYTQVPIREGLNFFRQDAEKTLEYFVRLGRYLGILGVEPYMFIADMHPRTNQYYVPLEPLLRMWCRFAESHDYPGIERPRTLSILFEQGNLIMSGAHLLCMRKSVDTANRTVTYHIPSAYFLSNSAVVSPEKVSHYLYKEPLVEGQNDDPDSLADLRSQWELQGK